MEHKEISAEEYFKALRNSWGLISDRHEPDLYLEWTDEEWEKWRKTEEQINLAMFGKQRETGEVSE